MIKKLLTIASILVTIGLNAQSGRSIRNSSLKQVSLPQSSVLLSSKTTTGQTCDSIQTIPATATISIAGAGTDSTVPTCTALAGYVYGTNCYDDREKTNFFDGATYYGSVPNLSVNAVYVLFWRDALAGEGTQGGVNATVGMKFYNGNVTSGPSGAGYGSTVIPMATIVANAGSNNLFYYKFTYVTPVPVPATGFFASVVLPTANPGDTAVIASQVSPTANIVWERFADNSWHAVTETPISWGAPGNLMIIPKYCFDLSGVGISQNNGISENVTVYPNPSSGIVRIQTTFLTEENVNVTITNALGQVVASTKKSAMVDLLTLDLSNQANGVYFVSVSNGSDKMVTRLVLNK